MNKKQIENILSWLEWDKYMDNEYIKEGDKGLKTIILKNSRVLFFADDNDTDIPNKEIDFSEVDKHLLEVL